MWMTNPIFMEDLLHIQNNQMIPWQELYGKTVLITGATGLIGYTLASALLHYEMIQNAKIQLIALVRDLRRAKEKFAGQISSGCNLKLVEGTVENLRDFPEHVDYVIHCACPTASSYFVSHPVDTVRTIVCGTQNILELAKDHTAKGVVFLSSMEVYGQITVRDPLRESDIGYIDLSSPRSSYPEGKRLAENLCCCYADQFDLPVSVARLVQTFGPGVALHDSRVFAYMARCAKLGEDIRLNTSGAKENMYLYIADAVSAILLLLLRGEAGTSYNVANKETYCSVKEMANLVAQTIGEGKIKVLTNLGGDSSIYRPEGYLNLDTSRMEALGWKASFNLRDMFFRMFTSF